MSLLDDKQLMQLALNEAKYALQCGEVPVGCVIVHKDSQNTQNVNILASGSNKTNETRNVRKLNISFVLTCIKYIYILYLIFLLIFI